MTDEGWTEMDSQELAERLRISVRTLSRMENRGELKGRDDVGTVVISGIKKARSCSAGVVIARLQNNYKIVMKPLFPFALPKCLTFALPERNPVHAYAECALW